jgi:hypothetical protein
VASSLLTTSCSVGQNPDISSIIECCKTRDFKDRHMLIRCTNDVTENLHSSNSIFLIGDEEKTLRKASLSCGVRSTHFTRRRCNVFSFGRDVKSIGRAGTLFIHSSALNCCPSFMWSSRIKVAISGFHCIRASKLSHGRGCDLGKYRLEIEIDRNRWKRLAGSHERQTREQRLRVSGSSCKKSIIMSVVSAFMELIVVKRRRGE